MLTHHTRLQANLLRYMLVGSCFLFVCSFPALQIPNFETAAIAHERDLIFQADFLAEFVWQNEPALPVCDCMLSPRVQLTQEHATIACGNVVVCFRSRTHFRELLWRHDQKTLVCRFRQKNEIFRTIAAPAGRDGDSILVVNGMPELSGVERFGLRIGIHCLWSNSPLYST